MNKIDITENDYQLIEAFFDCTLTKEELTAFEQRMKTDNIFSKQVDLYEYAKNKVFALYYPQQEVSRNAFRKKLAVLKKRGHFNRQKKLAIKLLSMAASIVLVLFIGIGQFGGDYTPEERFAVVLDYADKINTDEIGNRNRTANSKEIRNPEQILAAFEAKDYSELERLFDGIPDAKLIDVVLLIKGNTLLHLGNGEDAIPYFEEVIEEKGTLTETALWNLVAVYLKIDEAKAVPYLNQIITENFKSKEEAEKVLKGLK